MKRVPEHIFTTKKVDTFLGIDTKVYVGLFSVLAFYLGACIIAFVEYVLNHVDFVHITAVVFLFAIGVAAAWILGEGWYLSRQAVMMEAVLLKAESTSITWKNLSRMCRRKNSVRLVDRMLRKGFLKRVRIHIENKTIQLEKQKP